jgi:transposase
MSSKSKTSRREHSFETIAIILTLKSLNKSHDEIVTHLKLSKFTIITILHRHQRQENAFLRSSKRVEWSLKLNARVRRRLIRHVKTNSHDNFAALIIFSKSNIIIHRVTVRRYLRVSDYLRYKTRSKFFLSSKHKQVRLKWAREHENWTLKNWLHVIWIDEIIFEMSLDTRTCYVSRRKDTIMKERYLKLTFKNERSILSIWEVIVLRIKNLLHFLQKDDRMNFETYVNQMLKELNLSFYRRCVRDRDYMIWMNDEIDYHISDYIIKWRRENKLKRMHWSTQSSDLNLIENLWRLIKLRVSDRRHRIRSMNQMKRAIQKEWNRLTKKNFRVTIESMSRRCQIVIKARERHTKYWFI